MKIFLKKFCFFIAISTIGHGPVFAGSVEQSKIAADLFKLPSGQINFDYNSWGKPWAEKSGKCLGYDGGHSGLDMQTKDKSTNRPFYSLTNGTVINTGGTYNTIAVYDPSIDKTVIYLHASRISVRLNQTVSKGTQLGFQGDKGVRGAYHVHLEVRPGKKTGPACGASSTVNPDLVFNTRSSGDASAPKLSEPFVNSVIPIRQSVKFAWSAPQGSKTYRLVISQNKDFSGFNDSGDQSTCSYACATYKLNTNSYSRAFENKGVFYWKVRTDISGWSEVRSFSTK